MGCSSFSSRWYDAGLDGQWTNTGMEGGLCMIVLVGNTSTCTLYSVHVEVRGSNEVDTPLN